MDERLNIAMVVRAFATDGGLELYTHRVVEGLLNRGHRVTVFCQSRRSSFAHPSLQFEQIELRSDRLPKRKRLQHDFDAGNAALAGRAHTFDIVHSQHYPTAHASVVTFHNHTVGRWSDVGLGWERTINDVKSALVPAYKIRDEHDRELCENAACLIFPARVMQEDFFEAYEFLSKRQTPHVVAYPGASFPGELRTPSAQLHEPFTFLFVGRGFRRKGLDIVLAACAQLKKHQQPFRLLIAGLKQKPLDAARLRLLGLSKTVEYLGFRQDMDNVYGMADAAVLPSRVEPFGMAPLQAMSFGLLPIVSRVSGVSEVLTHEHDCLILEDHLSASELAGHMARLMEDRALTHRLRAAAPATAARINWDQTVESTLSAYRIVCGRAKERQAALK